MSVCLIREIKKWIFMKFRTPTVYPVRAGESSFGRIRHDISFPQKQMKVQNNNYDEGIKMQGLRAYNFYFKHCSE